MVFRKLIFFVDFGKNEFSKNHNFAPYQLILAFSDVHGRWLFDLQGKIVSRPKNPALTFEKVPKVRCCQILAANSKNFIKLFFLILMATVHAPYKKDFKCHFRECNLGTTSRWCDHRLCWRQIHVIITISSSHRRVRSQISQSCASREKQK